MYCICCGKKLEDGTKFCPICGMPVKEAFEKPVPKSTVVMTARLPKDQPQPASQQTRPERHKAPERPKAQTAAEEAAVVRSAEPIEVPAQPAAAPAELAVPTQPAEPAAPADDNVPVSVTQPEDLMDYTEYIIDEKVSAFKFANAYKIYDTAGNIIGGIQQVNISGGAKAARLLMGSSMKAAQGFQFNILDNDGRVLTSIKRGGMGGGMAALRTVSIMDGSGNLIGYLKMVPGLKPHMNITDASENIFCSIDGDTMGRNFVVKDMSGKQIGEINKKFAGVARTVFTTADRYRVALYGTFSDVQKDIVTTATIAVDMIMHEFR